MKVAKSVGAALPACIGLVVAETFLGLAQPMRENSGIPMLGLATNASGESHDRRLAPIESDERLYASAHR